MIRHSVRRFATVAYRAAELASKVDMANQYGVQLAKAQQPVNGLVGGSRIHSNLMEILVLRVLQQLAILLSSALNACQTRPAAKS